MYNNQPIYYHIKMKDLTRVRSTLSSIFMITNNLLKSYPILVSSFDTMAKHVAVTNN